MASARLRTILNVDDDRVGREALSRILERAGFDVMEAASADEALRLVQKRPDLVLLDVILPDQSGFEVCRHIKSDPAIASTPVLMISGIAVDSENRVQGLEGGADGYVIKPIEPTELLAHARALLRAREAEDALRASEERFRLISKATNDAVRDWNLRTNEVWWNEAVTPLFGYPTDAVGPDISWWYDRLHPEDRTRVVTGVRKIIGNRLQSWSDEYRFKRADHSYAQILDRGYLTYDGIGEPVRMISAMLDVSRKVRPIV